jgi:prepilin-type N-terminal cleavage/methylation domain-containing protein
MRKDAPPTSQRGFTLVEVLVSITVIMVGVLGSIALVDGANATTGKTKRREAAVGLARELLETARSVPHNQISPSAIESALQASSGVGDDDPSTAGWQVVRRNTSFTITASACTVDDPRDGSGVHDATFCSDSAAGTADSKPDDYRRATVTVTPPTQSGIGPVSQATAVSEAGTPRQSGAAATSGSVTSGSIRLISCGGNCNATALNYNQIYPSASSTYNSTAITAITFEVKTSGSPASVKWWVDGELKGSASPVGTDVWNFVWNSSTGLRSTYPDQTTDGPVEFSAQSYDAAGEAIGPRLVRTYTLNRFRFDASAFNQAIAGRNPQWLLPGCTNTSKCHVPEIEWYPRAYGARMDRDLYAFRLWKTDKDGTSTVPASGALLLPWRNAWTDWESAASSNNAQSYTVIPVDKDYAGNLRYGTSADDSALTSRDVNSANTRPTAPSGLSATLSGSDVTLSWTPPSGSGDADSGDCVDTFRIYRTSTSATAPTYSSPTQATSTSPGAGRYDRTPFGVVATGCGTSASTSFTDTNTGGAQHKYWVTSVDTKMAESTLVGPVTQ